MQPKDSVTLALSVCQLLIVFQKANIFEENKSVLQMAQESVVRA
jgi:hypothetical protein